MEKQTKLLASDWYATKVRFKVYGIVCALRKNFVKFYLLPKAVDLKD